MAKTKTPAVTRAALPRSVQEAAGYLEEITECQVHVDDAELQLQQELSAARQRAHERVEPHVCRAQALANALFDWAQTNRSELTDNDRLKTVDLVTGVLRWYRTPPSVRLTKKEEVVIATLKKLGFVQFIRVIEEIDREALLREREVASRIQGIRFGQDEIFAIKPAGMETELELIRGELKKAKPVRPSREAA
ncbi:MAG: host-nuclease inhibitor Gam family protein [Candidatus Kerfeldbacteria bacterium]|nr:host-nuclease inhibitor Gam family protein [Candidatus Kerfeldbacteria bacterium]